MSSFAISSKEHFNLFCSKFFASLKPGETASLQLSAEQTLFIRLNGGRVRQNTDVEQKQLQIQLQAEGRTVNRGLPLTGNLEHDLSFAHEELAQARADLKHLPADPFQVAMKNNGASEQDFEGHFPAPATLIKELLEPAVGLDFSGLFCGGYVIAANQNSLGQRHWFSTKSFFMDYSLYDGSRAAKGIYAGSKWNASTWSTKLHQTREQLDLLTRDFCNVPPGRYRAYLAPAAVSEFVNTISWGGLSYAAFRQGRGALRRLSNNEAQLSPKLSVRENFAMGLRPAFNSIGEVSATQVPLITDGKLTSLLISARSAQEYSVPGNLADLDESPRALEIMPGSLKECEILKELGTGLYLSNLHYLNWSDLTSARITGMTRYACFWVENGKIVGPIKDLRFDVSLYDMLGSQLRGITDFQEIQPATSTYESRSLGGEKLPGLLVDDFPFTL